MLLLCDRVVCLLSCRKVLMAKLIDLMGILMVQMAIYTWTLTRPSSCTLWDLLPPTLHRLSLADTDETRSKLTYQPTDLVSHDEVDFITITTKSQQGQQGQQVDLRWWWWSHRSLSIKPYQPVDFHVNVNVGKRKL
jgi:hypothetical protein